MIGFIRHCFIDPFEIVLRKHIHLDDPSYFSELSDEDNDADPIEFDARKLLFGFNFVPLTFVPTSKFGVGLLPVVEFLQTDT